MTTTEALLEQHRAEPTEPSFHLLYQACTPRLYGFALRLARGDAEEASDLVQETWLRALTRLDRYRSGCSVAAWLNGFVLNCWRETRRNRARLLIGPTPDGPAARDTADAWLDRIALSRAVDALADGYREVLLLHDVEGHTHEEIADLLGVTVGTSKSQLSRARRALRAQLAPHQCSRRMDS